MSDSVVERRRRLAAMGALASLAALVALVAVVLYRHSVELVGGVVGLSVAVAGAWWLVTEVMPRRMIGVIGLAAGAVLLGLSIARGVERTDQILLRLVVLIVLVAVMLWCARAAMLRDLRRVDAHVRVGGPPRHAVLLCNPKSGGGKVDQFGLIGLANDLGVETVVLDPGRDLEMLARDAVSRGADCLGMAGGDGSQALVASIAVEHGLPFVCVSAGTRNHFALDLGLNRDDPRESVYAFRDAIERRVDYATINDRLFVNNVSLGVYAEIVQQESYRDAKVETSKTLLPEMLSHRAEPFDLQFTTPDGGQVDGAILVMVSNNPYVIGLSPDNAQRRSLDSGRLGIFAVTTSTGTEAARLFAAAAIGQRIHSRYWKEFTATRFEVRARSGRAFAGVDGEALDLQTPLRFNIYRRGLTLLVPRASIEAAERRRAHAVRIGSLIALAAGHEPDATQ
jgi:diacylglycerol kinase family enzyme